MDFLSASLMVNAASNWNFNIDELLKENQNKLIVFAGST